MMNLVTGHNLFSLFKYHLPRLHNDGTMTHFTDLL